MDTLKPQNYPWKNIEEFYKLFSLFPEKIRTQKHPSLEDLLPFIGEIEEALRILKIWTKKSNNFMFTTTYEVMKKVCQLLKHGNNPDRDFLKDSLSIGLVRIVNAVTDSKQDKGPGTKKLSMTEVAQYLKFPVKAVKERNLISHSQKTPPFRQLIEVYRDIYRWVFITFWNPLLLKISQEIEIFNDLYHFVETLSVPNREEFAKELKEQDEGWGQDIELQNPRKPMIEI